MQPQRKPFNPVWILVGLAVTMCGGGLCFFGSCAAIFGNAANEVAKDMDAELKKDEAKREKDQEKEVKALKAPPISVTADALWQAYSDNTVAADKKYLDKVVKVRGKLDRVSEMMGSFHVYLTSDKATYSATTISVEYPESMRENVANLKDGYIYELTGVCKGERMGIVSVTTIP